MDHKKSTKWRRNKSKRNSWFLRRPKLEDPTRYTRVNILNLDTFTAFAWTVTTRNGATVHHPRSSRYRQNEIKNLAICLWGVQQHTQPENTPRTICFQCHASQSLSDFFEAMPLQKPSLILRTKCIPCRVTPVLVCHSLHWYGTCTLVTLSSTSPSPPLIECTSVISASPKWPSRSSCRYKRSYSRKGLFICNEEMQSSSETTSHSVHQCSLHTNWIRTVSVEKGFIPLLSCCCVVPCRIMRASWLHHDRSWNGAMGKPTPSLLSPFVTVRKASLSYSSAASHRRTWAFLNDRVGSGGTDEGCKSSQPSEQSLALIQWSDLDRQARAGMLAVRDLDTGGPAAIPVFGARSVQGRGSPSSHSIACEVLNSRQHQQHTWIGSMKIPRCHCDE